MRVQPLPIVGVGIFALNALNALNALVVSVGFLLIAYFLGWLRPVFRDEVGAPRWTLLIQPSWRLPSSGDLVRRSSLSQHRWPRAR